MKSLIFEIADTLEADVVETALVDLISVEVAIERQLAGDYDDKGDKGDKGDKEKKEKKENASQRKWEMTELNSLLRGGAKHRPSWRGKQDCIE